MDGGQSVSFTSFDSYNYPSHHNLTFHEGDPLSQRDLAKDSTIRNFPGKVVDLAKHPEILVMLQKAQIQRLTIVLHEYRMKFKRILNNQKDYNSFKNQANELLQVKDELELRNKRIEQYAESQKGEIVDQSRYVQKLESKYLRALKLIEQTHLNKQQLEQLNAQLKQELISSQSSFETFKQQSIQEYQRLREELEGMQSREIESQIQELTFKLKQKQDEIQGYKREQERYRHKNLLYEDEINKQNQQITKLSTSNSALTTKINQLALLIEEKNVQIKLKDNKLTQEIQNHSQVLSKSEFYFNKEMEETRMTAMSLAKELEKVKKETMSKQDMLNKRNTQFQSKLKELEAQKADLNLALSRETNKVKILEQRYNQQVGKLNKDVQVLRKKVEESYVQKRNLEETFRRQQRDLMQKSMKLHEQKWDEINAKYIQSNQKIRLLIEQKQSLQKTIQSLKYALQKSQVDKEEIRKCRTFESMIHQIQALCQKNHEKEGQISQLKQVIVNLEAQTKEVRQQLEALRQATVKLINMGNANESNRREDNYLMIEEIKKLFLQNSIGMDQIKQNTHRIAYNYNRHKQFLEASQVHLVKSKDLEIEDLKEKLNLSSRQTQSKNQLKEIINKIIVITKENSELKVLVNRRLLQNDQLTKEIEALKLQLYRISEISNKNIQEKEEICKRLLSQLEQSNYLLLEERQNQVKLQSSLIFLEEEKDKSTKQFESRINIINQLKNTIKTKDGQINQLNKRIDDVQKARYEVQLQLRKIIEDKNNLQIINKQNQQMIQQLKERNERNEKNFRGKESQFQKYQKQMMQKLSQNNEESNLHISKLKDQVNTLIAVNSQLKEDLIKTGSSIFNLTEQNQRLQLFEARYKNQLSQCETYKQKTAELLENLHQHQIIKYQLDNLKVQNEYTKRQLQKNQKLLLGYSERIQILEKDLRRTQSIIEQLKLENSRLQSSNYEFSITIEKQKIYEQKIAILSEQIDRLQRERMNFIEELNICRLQISQDSTLDRQVRENQLLLVLLFAEIESTRDLLNKKDHQIEQLRKSHLR